MLISNKIHYFRNFLPQKAWFPGWNPGSGSVQNYSQANEKSISGERFFIRLRLIYRSAVNDFVFFRCL